jgi:hypothetical protein
MNMNITNDFAHLDMVGVAAELAEQGYKAGAPAHVSKQTRDIDAQVCRQLRCPGCRKRGLAYVPVQGPGAEYMILAVCERCNIAVEV